MTIYLNVQVVLDWHSSTVTLQYYVTKWSYFVNLLYFYIICNINIVIREYNNKISGELYTNVYSAEKLRFESLTKNAQQVKTNEIWNILKRTYKDSKELNTNTLFKIKELNQESFYNFFVQVRSF